MVVNSAKEQSDEESHDENEKDVRERISIGKLIQLTGDVLKGH